MEGRQTLKTCLSIGMFWPTVLIRSAFPKSSQMRNAVLLNKKKTQISFDISMTNGEWFCPLCATENMMFLFMSIGILSKVPLLTVVLVQLTFLSLSR